MGIPGDYKGPFDVCIDHISSEIEIFRHDKTGKLVCSIAYKNLQKPTAAAKAVESGFTRIQISYGKKIVQVDAVTSSLIAFFKAQGKKEEEIKEAFKAPLTLTPENMIFTSAEDADSCDEEENPEPIKPERAAAHAGAGIAFPADLPEVSLSGSPSAPSTKERVSDLKLPDVDIILKAASHVGRVAATAIRTYVETNSESLETRLEEATKRKESLYLRPKQTKIARAIEITRAKHVVIHFNREKEGDVKFSGTFKKVAYAVDSFTGEKFASAGMKEGLPPDDEIPNLLEYQDEEGFVHLSHVVVYPSKRRVGAMKTRLCLQLYEEGDLTRALSPQAPDGTVLPSRLTSKDEKNIFEHLIRGVARIHAKGHLHRDIKPLNIFLIKKEGMLFPIIGDLGTLCEQTAKDKVEKPCGTPEFVSPEYARTFPAFRPREVEAATTPALDVWALGCTLYLLLRLEPPMPWYRFNPNDVKSIVKAIANLPPDWFPEPAKKASLEHLVWRMLRVKPEERITMEGALKALQSVNWT